MAARVRVVCLGLVLLTVLWAAGDPQAASAAGAVPAGAAPPLLDPNLSEFPAATVADYSDLLEAPAGRHGHLFAGRDGRFYFEDGTRARFWGLNVAKEAVFQPKPVIDAAVDAIARAGFNLVRLHHVDDETGLLPAALAGSKQRLDLSRLDCLDYWIARLKARGIYVYLDLLDYRTFQEAEGVPQGPRLGRGAKPYAVFNERLQELQRDYAGMLLFDHVNPYTRLSYAADPAVCLVELCDENGLFHEQTRLGNLLSPYREELVKRWNFWLLSHYGSREELARSWTDRTGKCCLQNDEDPRRGNVALPGVTQGSDAGVPRMASRSLFYATVHREYFRSMSSYLRSRGLRCPLSAVTKPEVLPDLWASARELDFTATNYYYDHPYFRQGSEWRLPGFFSGLNVLSDEQGNAFAPRAAAARVLNKPLVIREWGSCWPNNSRSAGMLEATAYACLQDVDAMILFTYSAQPGARALDYFDVRHDPVRWGLAAVCGRAFLEGRIQPAEHGAAVAYSTADVFYPGADPLPGAVYELSRVVRLGNAFFDRSCGSLADLTLAAGRTGAEYTGNQTILSSDRDSIDCYGRGSTTAAVASGYPAPGPTVDSLRFRFGGTGFGASGLCDLEDVRPFSTRALGSDGGLRAIGTSEDGRFCFGLRDMKRGNYIFGRLEDPIKLRVALDALGQLHNIPVDHTSFERGAYSSDTQELVIDHRSGVLWIATPAFCAVTGALRGGEKAGAGALGVQTGSAGQVQGADATTACVWQSLDGKSAAETSQWVIKYVTSSANTAQKVRPHLVKEKQSILALDAAGTAPVTTDGRVSDKPLVLQLSGQEVLRANLRNGSLELLRRGEDYALYCDTPGALLQLPQLPATLSALVYSATGSRRVELRQPFAWPSDAVLIEVLAPVTANREGEVQDGSQHL